MVNQQHYQEAKRRVQQIAGFYQHLIVFVLVNAGLVLINLASEPDNIWFLYPLLGWGIGITAHGLKVFLAEGWTKTWEKKKIRELLEKESGSN